MSDPEDPVSGFLFRRAVLIELDRLMREFPKRWSPATVRAVLASLEKVEIERLFHVLESIEDVLVALPRPPDSG